MLKRFLPLISVLTISCMNAFAAPSVRGANIKATTPTTARAGTLRIQQLKSTSPTNPADNSAQKVTTSNEIEDESIRIPVIKSNKSLSGGKSKDNASANQTLNQIDSRINELTEKLDAAEATQNTIITESNIKENIESVTYTKEEIEELIAELNEKIPKVDDRGNLNLMDPNGNLVVVHMGDVVIGGDDTIIVDGNLSTTSTHPIQNQAVTNALNEKQNKSTNLSFGNANGGWTHVASGSDYIELYTNPAGSKGFRIRPTMITYSLENMENEDQLITAGAVQEAIAAITANPGGGTQQSPYFNLINLETRLGGLVERYTYETNASYIDMQNFASNFCTRPLSSKWCHFYQKTDTSFAIIVRAEGHYLLNYDTVFGYDNTGSPKLYTTRYYAVNVPDEVNMIQYSNENFCNNRDTCFLSSVHLNDDMNTDPIGAIYNVLVYSEATRLTELPEKYKEESQQTLK